MTYSLYIYNLHVGARILYILNTFDNKKFMTIQSISWFIKFNLWSKFANSGHFFTHSPWATALTSHSLSNSHRTASLFSLWMAYMRGVRPRESTSLRIERSVEEKWRINCSVYFIPKLYLCLRRKILFVLTQITKAFWLMWNLGVMFSCNRHIKKAIWNQ